MKTILIIEDDIWISQSLKLYLKNSNYKVETHDEWNQAINKIKRINPDLIIIDINLPWKDWLEITKELREFSKIPVIMLTARRKESDKVLWIELWADDYIEKPFSPRELLARVNWILRRINSIETKESIQKKKDFLVFNNIEIDTKKMIVKLDWKEISFTKNEYDILKKIFEADWVLVSRDSIMKEVIGYDKYLYDRTIDTHIKNLRRKLWEKDIILTIRWEWYRLNK